MSIASRTHARDYTKMARKQRSDSISAQAKDFATANDSVELPNGIEFSNEDEKTIWDQFTKTRSKDSWRDFDLVLLAKVVKLEANIRKYQSELDQHGAIIENQRGTPIENPLFRVIDTLQRQQMAIIRSMSLNQTASDPRVLNATGKTQAKTRQTVEKHKNVLIPMPDSYQ